MFIGIYTAAAGRLKTVQTVLLYDVNYLKLS